MERVETDIVVVGAGLAGLTAARTLVAAGREAVVVEARERVGGRTLNHAVGPGPEQVVELGGQWVGPTQERALALARELGLGLFPTYAEGEHRFERDGRVRGYRGTIPPLGPVALAEVGVAFLRLNRMARRVDPAAPWRAAGARRLDEQTLASWLRRTVHSPLARRALHVAVEAVWSADAADLSLLHALFYIRAAGSVEALLDTEGGAQQDRVRGGSQLLSERMAAALGERVRLGAPVRRVEHGPEGVRVLADGLEATGRRAVVALPPVLAGRLQYEPALPPLRDGLTQRAAMGSVVKCMAVYTEPFWRHEGRSGHATSLTGPPSIVYDSSPPDGSPGVLLAFLEGRAARELQQRPAAERRDAVLAALARIFGPRARTPEGWVEQAWDAEPYSRGGYAGLFAPGTWTQHGPALRAPVGPLHWAGSETATAWAGYMDGAIQSGERAAQEVLAGDGG